jgi:nitroreductase
VTTSEANGDYSKMDLYEVMKTRRSIRSYLADPISEEKLSRILEAVRISPSGSNRQPWKFILVKDKELKTQVARACSNQEFVAEAPLIVVACGYKIPTNRGGYMGDMGMLVDVAIAFTHMILAARAEGLGTCWIGSFENDQVKKILQIPDDANVAAISPLGYPKQEFSASSNRKTMKEILATDKF